jgi:2-polyprenyl-3-methyl-5-hydroxy-6-metoxy-1,4-benzoquinol methylase
MYILQTDSLAGADPALRRIVAAYDDVIVRAYCTVRFTILRQRFLFEIGQYLPPSGQVLDVGCGFGLFTLYFALRNPRIQVRGFDLDERRIGMARKAAERLGLNNATFQIANAASFYFNEPISGAYMLDLVHHIPEASVPVLLKTIASNLAPDSRLLVKDIDPTGRYKRAFTWVLDKAMDYKAPVNYWYPDRLQRLLEGLGFEVHRHQMIDYLPYPHILYVNRKIGGLAKADSSSV